MTCTYFWLFKNSLTVNIVSQRKRYSRRTLNKLNSSPGDARTNPWEPVFLLKKITLTRRFRRARVFQTLVRRNICSSADSIELCQFMVYAGPRYQVSLPCIYIHRSSWVEKFICLEGDRRKRDALCILHFFDFLSTKLGECGSFLACKPACGINRMKENKAIHKVFPGNSRKWPRSWNSVFCYGGNVCEEGFLMEWRHFL